jgi:hypothetical protein
MIVFLAFTAEKAKLNIIVGGLDASQRTLLLGYVLFTYIVSILVCIAIYSDLIGNEESFEFILLSTSRFKLLIGKFFATCILLLLLSIESFLAFIITLFSYNIQLPSLTLLFDGFLFAYLSALILPASICLLASTFALRFNFHSSIASYISIFTFFVIPFIIYFSFFQIGLFQLEMLDFSIHTYIQRILENHFLIVETGSNFQNILLIVTLSVVGYLLSIIFFISTPLNR